MTGEVFAEWIRSQAEERPDRRLDIMVAGCGRTLALDVAGVEARITGADEDTPHLRSHTTARGDLASWWLGDLRSVPITPRVYDVVCVEFLLDRIEYPELVLDRLVDALRPGGLLLMRVRDRDSAYGFLDRVTPEWMRGALWRFLAPSWAVGPCPAVYPEASSREGALAYCMMRGLMVAEQRTTASGPARLGPRGGLVEVACRLVGRLSRGRLPAAHDEITLVVRKPQNHFARLI